MFAIACRCSRLFPLVTMIAISLVSAAEARHWRYNGYYGFYWPDRSTRRDRTEVAAPRNSQPLVQTSGFGLAIAHMIRACEEQSVELRKTPFDVISRTVRPSEPQENALDTIRSAVSAAADNLATTCPKDIPAMPSERLDVLRHTIECIIRITDDHASSVGQLLRFVK
jgi:hypothetical protein